MSKNGVDWTKYRDILQECIDPGLKWSDIAEEFRRRTGLSVSDEAVRKATPNQRKRPEPIKKPLDQKEAQDTENFLKHANFTEVESKTPFEILDKLDQIREFNQSFDIGQYIVESSITASEPVGLIFSSDWHIGSPACNYGLLNRHLAQIRDNKRLFLMVGGDPYEGFIPGFPNATAVVDQTTKPLIQIITYGKILDTMANCIVAIMRGNHENFESRKTGMDSSFFVIKGKKIPFLPHGGLVKLTVGKTLYNILWKHKWRYNSSLNLYNSHHRMREKLYPMADIVVQEHQHNPGVEQTNEYEFDAKKRVVNIRTGSYKMGDGFSRDFWKDGVPGSQAVILFPDRHKIVTFDGPEAIEDAEAYLNGYKKTT